MSSLFRKLQSIDKDTKSTVFGYIRQTEDELSLYCIVALRISFLCLSYYHQGEYFEKAGDDIKISNDKLTITKILNDKSWYNTTYGKTWINSGVSQIVKWKFKVNKMKGIDCICLCLVSSDNRLNKDCNHPDDKLTFPNFGIDSAGFLYIRQDPVSRDYFPYREKYKFHQGDIISMILDTQSKELYFKRNEGDKLILIQNIPTDSKINYKMAISLKNTMSSISLIDFIRYFR